jgi:hypothetical protein
MGGMICCIGSALHEKTELDARLARCVDNDIAEYLVPVNADVQQLEVILVPELPIRNRGPALAIEDRHDHGPRRKGTQGRRRASRYGRSRTTGSAGGRAALAAVSGEATAAAGGGGGVSGVRDAMSTASIQAASRMKAKSMADLSVVGAKP